MPVSANTNYDAFARTKQLTENWRVEFDNSSGGTLRLAFADCYVDDLLYRGMVTSDPSLRSSIDLVKSKLSISNFSVECANGVIGGIPLSELLVFGSVKYINWPVRVCTKSWSSIGYNSTTDPSTARTNRLPSSGSSRGTER